MKEISRAIVNEFVAACRRVVEMGLARCSSGNLSWRVGHGLMLIKASRAWMGKMTAKDVAVCRISDGLSLNGKAPSVETRFHAGVLSARRDVNVVLHFQTPFATVLACRRGRFPNVMVIPEIPFYIGLPVVVPYYPPGSKELARAVVEGMKNHNMVVMRHHGQVTVAADFDHAFQNAVFFELACEIVARNGRGCGALPAAEVRRLCGFSAVGTGKV